MDSNVVPSNMQYYQVLIYIYRQIMMNQYWKSINQPSDHERVLVWSSSCFHSPSVQIPRLKIWMFCLHFQLVFGPSSGEDIAQTQHTSVAPPKQMSWTQILYVFNTPYLQIYILNTSLANTSSKLAPDPGTSSPFRWFPSWKDQTAKTLIWAACTRAFNAFGISPILRDGWMSAS